jgi:hypothetical protein
MTDVEKGKSGFDSLSIDDLKMDLPPPSPDQPAPPSPRRKGKQQFIMVPLHWEEKLAKAKHLATYRVALHLLFQIWKKRGKTLTLSNMSITDKGVSPRDKWRALKELEQCGLIKVTRNHGKSPRVAILE